MQKRIDANLYHLINMFIKQCYEAQISSRDALLASVRTLVKHIIKVLPSYCLTLFAIKVYLFTEGS